MSQDQLVKKAKKLIGPLDRKPSIEILMKMASGYKRSQVSVEILICYRSSDDEQATL
jgi:hypothetical protein